jgi:hypothetical protein
LIVPPCRQETLGDLLLQRPCFFEQRIETPKERSEFFGGKKTLIAHGFTFPLDRRIPNIITAEKQNRLVSSHSSVFLLSFRHPACL